MQTNVVPEDEKALKSHGHQTTLERDTELDALTASVKSRINEMDDSRTNAIRLNALFARMGEVIAQNKKFKAENPYVDFQAQHDAFMKKLDEEKAQRLRDAEIPDALGEVQEDA